jgi:hypothetical protein
LAEDQELGVCQDVTAILREARMTQRIEIRSFTLDDELLQRMDHRKRNQLLGCMHAHNELTFLNRLLLFSQNSVSEGNLHDHAQSSQMWCVIQLLAGKLYETWNMLARRFSFVGKADKHDPVITALEEKHRTSLVWLQEYFGEKGVNSKPIVVVRNKTAFHYGGLDMGAALKNLTSEEKAFHVARHPVNTLYWIGSAAVFGAIFAEIAILANPESARQRVDDGFYMLRSDINDTNFHLHQVLYGLIKGLVEDALGHPLGAGDVTNIDGAPTPSGVALCPWVDVTPAA